MKLLTALLRLILYKCLFYYYIISINQYIADCFIHSVELFGRIMIRKLCGRVYLNIFSSLI